MSRQRFTISEEQTQELEQAYRATKNADTRTRFQAVRLYTQGYATDEIFKITGTNQGNLMEWCRKYREQGIEGLEDHRGGRQAAKLSEEQLEEVYHRLRQYRPRDLFGPQTHTSSGEHWTVEDLMRAIKQWYSVTWKSRTSYLNLFATVDFSYQRTEKVYKSRREHDVADFEADLEKN
jgi:transposase